MTGPENVGHAMGWSHEDSWEVCLVLRVLETVEGNSESVDPGTGEVRHSVSFTRERSISKFHGAVGKRFDFSVMVDNGEFPREFLIEVHGEQHYEHSFLGERVRESDRLKEEWAKMYGIPLLVLSNSDVVTLHFEDRLMSRICEFLGISNSLN